MSYRTLINSRGVRLAAKERQPRQDKPLSGRGLKRPPYYLGFIEGLTELEKLGQSRLYRKLSKADLFDAFVDLYRQTHGEEPNLRSLFNDLFNRIENLKRQGLR